MRFDVSLEAFADDGYRGRNFDLPALVFRGPAQFSTDTDLVEMKTLTCWDVNRYYRDLGVPYPYTQASRSDLRKAYLLAGGPRDSRKTYVFKQLLNREVKARYDSWPLGPVVFLDKYVEAAIKAATMDEMHRRGMGREDLGVLADLLRDLGVELVDPEEDPDADTPSDDVDNSNANGQDLSVPASAVTHFPFSFYLWRTTYQDMERLADWQKLLINALAAWNIKTKLTLGYMGHTPHRWLLGRVGYRDVVYLHHETEPDPAVAFDIATRMHEKFDASAASTFSQISANS